MIKQKNKCEEKTQRQADFRQKVHLRDSPCILGFMCSYYRQQIIVHQEVTYCWVTEKHITGGLLSVRDVCFFSLDEMILSSALVFSPSSALALRQPGCYDI